MIKEILAPSVANSGVLKYWRGDYDKAFAHLSRAYRWSPQLFQNSEFQGYLGLCLLKLGRVPEAVEHLTQANEYLSKVASTENEIRNIQGDLQSEIDEALCGLNT